MENNNGVIYGGDYGEFEGPLDEGRGSLGAVVLNDLTIGGDKTALVSLIR